MPTLIDSVSAIAVWGSLLASLTLGSFMAVQAALDRERRWRFLAFSLVCFANLTIDLLFPVIDKVTYELLRVYSWALYGPAVVALVGLRWRAAAALAVVLLTAGLACWEFYDSNLATTVVLPFSFLAAALAHAWFYMRTKGYASCVLTAASLCQSLQCAFFYAVVSRGDPWLIALGYLHYGTITIASVLLGWVHLPRELRGRAPVTVPPRVALLFGIPFCVADLIFHPAILILPSTGDEIAISVSLLQFAALITLFFYHRQLLVVFTDNVSALLAERTSMLRDAQQELATQNKLQAKQLDEQARSLKEQSAVIERQRRLELAAQTAGQVAHDIGNLVFPLMTYLDILEKEDVSLTDVREMARRMRRPVSELQELNAQLLSLARRGQTERQPLDLRELLSELGSRITTGNVTIDAPTEAFVDGSWAQLGRAITNLIVNAIDVSPGKPVSVRCTHVSVSEARRCHLGHLQPGEYVLVEVRDRGPGIPGHILDRIFEPFFSSKKRSSRSGSGLGLSIVAAVIDDHRGVLDLETSADGTNFKVYIPCSLSRINTDRLRGSEKVLLVDDDAQIQHRLHAELSQLGYEVTVTKNGREALAAARRERFDLVILDLGMPVLDGTETLRTLVADYPQTAVVIHTTYVSPSKHSELMALGARAIVLKPCSPHEILRAFRGASTAVSQAA